MPPAKLIVVDGVVMLAPIQLMVPAADCCTSAPAEAKLRPFMLKMLVVLWVSAVVSVSKALYVHVPPVVPQAKVLGAATFIPLNVLPVDAPVVLKTGVINRPLVVVRATLLLVSLTARLTRLPVSAAVWE